jgi:hypothetical protein
MKTFLLALFYFAGLCWSANLYELLKSRQDLSEAAFFAEPFEYLLVNPANVTILVPNNDAVFRLQNVLPDYAKSLLNNTAKLLELTACKSYLFLVDNLLLKLIFR